MTTLSLILAGLGLAMFLEGLPYFIAPSGVKRYMSQIQQSSDGFLRLIGFALMVAGLAVAYLALN